MPDYKADVQRAKRKRSILESFREEVYPAARNKLARLADLTGGAQSDASTKEILHGQGNYNLTKKLGQFMPAAMAANLSDSAYLGNEALTGTMAKLTGRPFFSKYGFGWGDIAINRRGQDRAVAELEQEDAQTPAAEKSKRAVALMPGGGNALW
jgi:hypothetical protein